MNFDTLFPNCVGPLKNWKTLEKECKDPKILCYDMLHTKNIMQ